MSSYEKKLPKSDWLVYEGLYRRTSRDKVFFQMVYDDLVDICKEKTCSVLDVGCGGGFHHNKELQKKIGAVASEFLGIEPDPRAEVDSCFTAVAHVDLESAQISPNSIDLAYSSMVLEHVSDPHEHFRAIYTALRPGGVFWGFTVDSRHWFAAASAAMERIGAKEHYLGYLHGKRGVDRYENFPTRYQCNPPGKLEEHVARFTSREFRSFHKVGQLNFYVPRLLRPFTHTMERLAMLLGMPGSVLVVRLVK